MRVKQGIIFVFAAVAACGGDDGSSGAPQSATGAPQSPTGPPQSPTGPPQSPTGPPQSPTGVWGFTNDPAIPRAMISSAGRAMFLTADGKVFSGVAQVAGTDVTIEVEGYPGWGATFSDGSTHGMGELVGTVTTGGTLSASLSFTTDGGTPITADWTLPYYSFFETSSLARISSIDFTGGPPPADSILIDPSGVLSSLSASNGCILSGSVSTSDPDHNVYDVSYTVADCSGALQGLNGVQFTGLAFDSTNDVPGNLAPQQLIMAVTADSATANYGFSSGLIVAGF